MLAYILTALAVCGLDLFIKKRIEEAEPEEVNEKEILGGKIRITRFFNDGAVLGFLKEKKTLLLALQMGLTDLIGAAWLHQLLHKASISRRLGLSLLFGGALSNCYDRFYKKGKVTDYFRICIGSKKLEHVIFNIGDIAIFVGAALGVISVK